jgi:hypothetical protein
MSLTILDALDDERLFASAFAHASWRPWRALLGTMFALPLPPDLQSLARACTGRQDAPVAGPYREAWLVCGRRSGKSRTMALLATYLAAFRDWTPHLAPGEVATIAVIAADRAQARVAFRYIRGLLRENPMLARLVVSEAAERLELASRVAIEVFAASSVSVRGRSLAGAILDEIAFWPTDDAADPDTEILAALRPGLATLPGSMLIAASSPYARRGELWTAYSRHHGREGAPVLVWHAPSRTMNPALPAELVADELARDPDRAAAEWLAEWRRDVERYVAPEVAAALSPPGRGELPPVSGTRYVAFVDPSGGSQDAFTLAVAHAEGERAILDCVRERRPPFSPEAVVQEFAQVLASYGVATVVGDRYGGEWPREQFRKAGIAYEPSARPKSEIYGELLPLLNSARLELLDVPRLTAQLVALERRTSRSGKDSIDHAPNGHDDLINAAAGALVLAATRTAPIDFLANLILGAPLAMAGTSWPALENPEPVATVPERARSTMSVAHFHSAHSAFDGPDEADEPWHDW